MNHSKTLSRLSLVLTLVLAACYPNGPDYVEELDVVLTNYNSNFNFKPELTYAIPDKIVKITGNSITGDPPAFIPDIVGLPIIARINQNMTNLGYTKVDISASPNLILAPAAWEVTTVSYWYPYWGWYWGGYYPYWGYPYYPGGGGYYSSYSTGTLVMSLVDPQTQSADGNAISQWTGAASGVLTYSYSAERIGRLIDQAFAQSPYLKK